VSGVGDGLSSSLARLFHAQGYRLALAARNVGKLTSLVDSTDATAYECDAAKQRDVEQLFSQLNKKDLEVCIYNPSLEVRASIGMYKRLSSEITYQCHTFLQQQNFRYR
jgi:short-subunit dehydrogenase